MIRYPLALEGIEAEIGQAWLDKAKERTNIFRAQGRYVEEYKDPAGVVKNLQPFWGDVKDIYIKRQHGKCIYCESLLEWGTNAGIQWDLEHFRPKSNVRTWPPAKSPLRRKYATTPTGNDCPGYYLLAYSHLNYAAACKTCNSPYKSDYFPIASHRILADSDPAAYAGEKAFLIYPLGSVDTDPSTLIAFEGAEAKPRPDRQNDPDGWIRASILIDFFNLNRDGLIRLRAGWLYHSIWQYVKLADSGDPTAIRNLKLARTERFQHANCAGCFIDLCATDREAAKLQVEVFERILEITSGP